MLNKKTFNKKGQEIAPSQWQGILIFMFVFAFFILFLMSCVVQREEKTYEQFKFSKGEVDANKALNTFLESPHPVDPTKKISDLIIESYLNSDYSRLGQIAKEYFSSSSIGARGAHLIITKDDSGEWDKSYNFGGHYIGEGLYTSTAKLTFQRSGYEFIDVWLQIYK